jgi:hypothetical protein
MTIVALAKLRYRSEQLTTKLAFGSATEIGAARELLRRSLVELYELGYWRENPEQFKVHMRLYRACGSTHFSVPESMSAPDRRGRYSP